MKRFLVILGFVLPLVFSISFLSFVLQNQYNSSTIPFTSSASAFDEASETASNSLEPCYRGDANSDGDITIADVVFLVNYMFKSGDPPVPLANGDVDCVKGVTITDAVYIVNYLFKSGDEPCIPPEIFEISITSPHQANGIDSAELTIIFTDSCGNDARPPDFPAESFFDVFLYIGEDADEDSAPSFPLNGYGNGTYTVYITSTVAGQGGVSVTAFYPPFGPQGATKWEVVLYGANLTSDLHVLDVEQPREEEPRHAGKVIAVAVDSFQNVVHPPDANIIFKTDFGTVDSVTVDESGDFIGWISSWLPGDGMVTVTEQYSGLSQDVEITFPAYYLSPPVESYITGDPTDSIEEIPTGLLDVGLNIWNPQELALGFYDLVISFDSSVIRFLGAEDWDTTDGFPTPVVIPLDSSNVRISQAGVGGYSNDIARLIFEPVISGEYTPVIVDLWNNDSSSLSDIGGSPIYSLEEWWLYSELMLFEVGTTEKPPKFVNVKIWVAPGADAVSLINQIFNAFSIIRMHVGKCCPNIYPIININFIPDSTWDSLTGDNDSLDTRAERDSIRSRCNKPGSVDVIGTPDDALPGWSGVATQDDAVIVDSGATSTGTTMAHELAHYWGVRGHNDPSGNPWGKVNLMYKSTNLIKGMIWCVGLTPAQCATITAGVDP